MAVGFYSLTVAADVQVLATAFEAEANITAATIVGTKGEAATSVLFPLVTAAINDVGDIDASQTTITYDTVAVSREFISGIPVKATIDSEELLVTSATNTVITVERGIDGSVAAAHLDGAVITFHADVLAFPGRAVVRVVGNAVVDVTNAATAVGGVEVAAGYPAVA